MRKRRAAGIRRLLLALAAFAPVAGASAVLAQTPAGAIEGTVVSSTDVAPVIGATVLVSGTPLGAVTDENGHFRLQRIRPGAYTLQVVATGHEPAVLEGVEVGPGVTRQVEFVLQAAIVDVPGLVVTASRSGARPGESPASVAVLGKAEIERRNVNTLDEALPFAQGVIYNSGQLDIRGASGLSRGVGSRVLVLLDGHRLLKGVGSEADFETFPMLDVERVEVVKGPHSALYGTSALGGVINVITSRPPRTAETVTRLYYGSYDTPGRFRFTDETLSTQGAAVQHSRWIGNVGTTLYAGIEGSDGFRQNGGHKRWRARLKTVFPADSDRPLEAFVNWTRRDSDEFFTWLSEDRPLEVDPEALGDWLREDDLAVGLTLHPVANQSALLQVRPQFVYNAVHNHFHDNQTHHSSRRVATDVQLSVNPSVRHALSLGGEAGGTFVESDFLGSPAIADLAAYAQDEVEIADRVRGTAGVRLDYHDAESAESELALNPKVGVVYEAADGLSLRASLSRGYRAPSVSEQYTATTQFGFRVIPNLDLKGERAWAGEVGATLRQGGWLFADAALFYSDYDDLIEPSGVPGQFFTFQFQNVSAAQVWGLDTGLRLGLWGDWLSLKANYVLLGSEDSRTGEPLPYRSRHNLTVTADGFDYHVGVDLRYRSRVDEVLAFPLDDRGAITLVDLRLAYDIRDWKVMAKIANVFQNHYVDVQERNPGASRQFLLTVMPRF